MKKYIILFNLLFIINLTLIAQTLSGKIDEPSMGISFTIPFNLKGEKIQQGYILISENIKGFILVTPHNFNTIDEIVNNTKNGIIEDNGTYLSLKEELNIVNNNSVTAILEGTLEWQQVIAIFISRLSPFENGVSIIGFVERESFSEEYKNLVESVNNSLIFSQPIKVSYVDQWIQILNDCRLTYLNSYNSGFGGGGIQDKIIIDLCAKGYFNYQNESQVIANSGDVSGYSSGNRNGSGEWKVVDINSQTKLKLIFYDGSINEYVLSSENEKTFLNGQRYFRTYKNSDVEGTQPECE